MPLLDEKTLKEAMRKLPGWRVEAGALRRSIEFPDFPQAIHFVTLVAGMAERARHHPDIDIRYNRIEFTLVSHDAGGITERDIALAGEIEAAI